MKFTVYSAPDPHPLNFVQATERTELGGKQPVLTALILRRGIL